MLLNAPGMARGFTADIKKPDRSQALFCLLECCDGDAFFVTDVSHFAFVQEHFIITA